MDERPAKPTYDELVSVVAELRSVTNAQLRMINVELHARVERLQRRVGQLEAELRSRPPGPPSLPLFVKPAVLPKKNRPPGRPDGHPPALRAMPVKVDRVVAVPLKRIAGACVCPACSGELVDLKHHGRVVEEIIPARVRVTRYETSSGFCDHCKTRVESRHDQQPPAADVPHGQLGLRALITAAVLKHDAGLPYRKVARVLKDLCGLVVSPGALVKQVRRTGAWLGEPYDQIKRALRQSEFVHADETGAPVNGQNHWLWAFTSPRHTLFHLDKSRGGHVPLNLLGAEFSGVLVTDFFSAYNTLPYAQQKCLVHLLREIRTTSEKNACFCGSEFAVRLKRLVKDMLGLKKRWDEFDDATYTRRVCRLEDRLDALGRETSTDRDVKRLGKRIRKHATELTRFLLERNLPGENNAAERAIRPAVVIRKISGGHRGASTATAGTIITSVLRTARQQGRDLIQTVQHLVQSHLAGRPTDLLTSTSG